MSAIHTASARFKVGDWVSFQYGVRRATAQIIEDRGPLGINGERIYRIRLDRDSTEPDEFELREALLEPASLPDKSAVLKYLKEGGLVAILRANLTGGKDQPKVWLDYTPRGEVRHTFTARRGVLGGATVPFFALHEENVFTGKKDEVLGFLTSFGLTRHDAEDVLAAVGTTP